MVYELGESSINGGTEMFPRESADQMEERRKSGKNSRKDQV